MNSLSWLIYLADIVNGISAILAVFGFFGTVAGIAAFVAGTAPWVKHSWHNKERWAEIRSLQSAMRRTGKGLLIAAPISIIMALAIPSQTAIYMIAASEIGERVVSAPETIEMLDDLREIVRRRIAEELEE